MHAASKAMSQGKATEAATARSDHLHTPPDSPNAQLSDPLEFAKQVIAAVKLIQTSEPKEAPQLVEVSNAATGDCSHGQTREQRTKSTERASKLEIKKIHERWDAKAFQYKAIESIASSELSELDEFVFVVRTRLDRKSEAPVSFVDINSAGLRDILRGIFKDVKSANLRGDKPTIEQRLLYTMLPDLDTYQKSRSSSSPEDDIALEHLNLLINHVKEAYAPLTHTLKPLLKCGEITFDLLWSLFRPNEMVYTDCNGTGTPKCFRYDFGETITEFGITYFHMEGRILDYDGKRFGESPLVIEIPKFPGLKPIESLLAFPLDRHPYCERARAQLIVSGRKFIGLMGTHHQQYCGRAFIVVEGKTIKLQVNSRIMVDAEFFRENNPNYFNQRIESTTAFNGVFCLGLACVGKDTNNVSEDGPDPTKLSDDDLLRCCATVPGFSFGDKRWLEFAVADVDTVHWEPGMFDAVALPKAKKDVILSLAEARTGQLNMLPFDDIVPGKGRGLNVLLHGPPGMGKTLVAEAVSEHLMRPIYSISAGELGTDPAALEKRLTQIFHLGSHWNAVLLLDEADTYMEKRSVQDIHRNSLVAVFLRKLEYCGAILFLTTNRVAEFDDAILSRMHIMFTFPRIERDAKKQIWDRLIQRAHTEQGPGKIETKDLTRLTETPLNGRQAG